MTLAEANAQALLHKVRVANQLLEAAIEAGRNNNQREAAKLVIEAKKVLDE